MKKHIGCICLTFFHCVSSNVSSNRLPERTHNHTVCICLTFLHCVFSNGSSNGLHEKMHSHTGCICLTFFHCVFSNGSSKFFIRRFKVTLTSFVWLFSTVCFQMCLQSAFLGGCIITMVAFFGFSPLCVFKCFPKSPAWGDA